MSNKKIYISSRSIPTPSYRSVWECPRDTVRNPGSKEQKRSYENYKRKEYKMYENKYVVDRLLWTAHAAEADDLIRVEKVNRKTGKVILQPLLKKKIVVSLKDFERDYKIV